MAYMAKSSRRVLIVCGGAFTSLIQDYMQIEAPLDSSVQGTYLNEGNVILPLTGSECPQDQGSAATSLSMGPAVIYVAKSS